ncbi:sensor histidine kinase [Pseudoalteromonas luteoviolacea]|uniref:sensor histidine kinase n=1 Tax=Pseudoalteromonas luteoviolacea TaxID=43657 RepID=UPI001FFC86CA|nr:two-component regulator propeller domain-containing protein [Pseudoalteromonas luteoviolacea]
MLLILRFCMICLCWLLSRNQSKRVLSVCLLSTACQAGANPIFTDTSQIMRRFDYESGLSQVTIMALTEDQLGYIWIGTQAGLNRFDGHEFKQFTSKQQDPNALAGAFVTGLCHSGETVWIATSTGLSAYHTVTGRFQSFLKENYLAISSDRVKNLNCNGNYISVSTENHDFYVIDKVSLEPQSIKLQGRFASHAITYNGQIYYISERGFMTFSMQSSKSALLLAGDFKYLALRGERVFLITKDNRLVSYDTLYERILWEIEVGSQAGLELNTLHISTDRLFVGSNFGVYLYDLKGQFKKHWFKHEGQGLGLQDNSILSVLVDSNQDLWFGTETSGLHFISQLSENFGHVSAFNYPDRSLPEPDIRNFALDRYDRLWLATSSGLYFFDGAGFEQAQQVFPKVSVMENAFITKLHIQGEHMWIATRGLGMYRLNIANGDLINIIPDIGKGPELSFNDIIEFEGKILMSSRSMGLLYFNEKTNKLEPFLPFEDKAPSHVSSLLKQGDALIFGSIGDGLFKYEDDILLQLTIANSLASNIVFMLQEDSFGRIWAGSETGISIVDSNFSVVKAIKRSDGLANSAIWALLYDKQNHIWFGTSGGLSRVNIHDFKIDNFFPVDGVQGNEFNYNASWLAPDGRVFMGGSNGFNQFHPEEIKISPIIRPLLISNIELLGRTLHPSNNKELKLAPELTTHLELEYDQDIVSLHYSSLDYGSEGLRFYYRIIGLSEQWLKLADGVRQINLLKLAPGKYQVQAYTINRFNQISPVHHFDIRINAPWWWNDYTKAGYFLLSTLLLLMWFRQRQKRFQQVVNDNKIMNELQERLELSLWASQDEMWDWHINSNKIYRHSVKPRIDYGQCKSTMSVHDAVQFIHPKDYISWEEKLESCIDGEQDTYEIAIRVKTVDDDWTWVLERGKVVSRDCHGKVERLAGALKDIAELKAHQNALQSLNEGLEIKVAVRTDELYQKNQKLEQAMIELKRTQQELIESEKMASLGNVVAGIAHEINTPLGISITAISYNQESLKTVATKLENQTLKQSELELSIQEQQEGYLLMSRNLDRAKELISNFKQVAVDHSSEVQREINVKEYVEDVFISLSPLANGKQITLAIEGDTEINVNTYPGALYQILTNLYNNTILHGFEGKDEGEVSVNIQQLEGCWSLTYKDDGIGMNERNLNTLFDPFVTTKRNQGGCGLGMHIVYNLVTQLLKGEISAWSKPSKGLEIKLKVPITSDSVV